MALGAITSVLVSERRRRSTSSARAQRLASVVLVTVSLFPCVSASDDLISFAYVSAGMATRSGFGHTVPDNSGADPVIYLVLQSLEHLQISVFYTLFVVFSFFGLVCLSTPRSVLRQLPSSLSRGPPEFTSAG